MSEAAYSINFNRRKIEKETDGSNAKHKITVHLFTGATHTVGICLFKDAVNH